jgi:hypothetical protein
MVGGEQASVASKKVLGREVGMVEHQLLNVLGVACVKAFGETIHVLWEDMS